MTMHEHAAQHLASAFVCGRWQIEELVDRGADAFGKRWRWLRPLAQRLVLALGETRRPSRRRVLEFLRQDSGFRRACREYELRPSGLQRRRPEMSPAAGPPAAWDVPPLVTVGELADWLELRPEELDWFADRRQLERSLPPGPLRHYRYYWLSKRLGGSARLVEAPKRRLKAIQRRILHEILDPIPPHAAVHGFCAGRSIASFVAPHAGRPVVLKADLKDFFPSISKPRIVAVFRTAGYPEDVAQTLASLCTNVVPDDVWDRFPQYGGVCDRWRHEELYRRLHLPQGAPTSPALANLCSYRLDCRLAGLARAVDGQYTRYADDLLFSGPDALARSIRRFHATACVIVSEEGFHVNGRKTRIMHQGVRQSAAGLVFNQHANVARDEYDLLKATLHNCVRQGPASQNRDARPDFRAHLEGRVGFVESVNPARGARLRSLFDRIEWPVD
jgi:hypothetical protein